MDNTDPQVVALAKAIRQRESGHNFTAVGDNGTSAGGYQWSNNGVALKPGEAPANFKSAAQKFLGNPNAEFNPSNQNAVAYSQIKEWKDAGLNPAQIAAKWNSGSETGWENKIGTTTINGKPISYNVPAYVKAVTDYYQQYKPQGQTQPIQNPQDIQPEDNKSFLRKVGDFFTSGTQEFGKTIGNAVAAPQNADLFAQASDQYTATTKQLNDAIRAKVSSGGDASRLQIALKQHLQTPPTLQDFTGDVVNKSNEQVLGQAGQFGLEALSGGILEGGVKGVASKELSTLGKLGEGAKLGATYGGLTGGFGAMQNDGTVGDIAGGAALGAGTGAALGGALSGAGIVAGKAISSLDKSALTNAILPETESRVTKQMGWVQEAQDNIAKAYKDALPLTPTQQIKEAGLLKKTGRNVYTTLAKYNINVGSEEATSQLQAVSDQFENAINHAKSNEHALFNLDEMRNKALAEVNQNVPSETARIVAKNKINQEIEALLKANKSSVFQGANNEILVDSSLMERLRQTGNSWTPFNASDPEKVGKSAGWALANAVRDQVEKEGTFPAYREANREWGSIIHAQEVIQKIGDSGKQFKTIGGLGGSIARKLLSGVLGFHTGGIAGAILSEMGSEYTARILANPELRTYFDRKLLERFGAGQRATPEAILKLENEIRNYVEHQMNLPRLPAPSTIYVPPLQGGLPYTPNQ